jgi:hypothetical protein
VGIGVLLLSVVIRDLDIIGVAIAPMETNPKLIVDSNAVLPGAIAAELFQPETGKRKIHQRRSGVEKSELHARHILDVLELPAKDSIPEFFRLFVLAGAYHLISLVYYAPHSIATGQCPTKENAIA